MSRARLKPPGGLYKRRPMDSVLCGASPFALRTIKPEINGLPKLHNSLALISSALAASLKRMPSQRTGLRKEAMVMQRKLAQNNQGHA